MNGIMWTSHGFSGFDLNSLYALLAVRQQVFVVEQNCAYLDADGIDNIADHIMGRDVDGNLIAYCRIYPRADGWHIGRVLVVESHRRQGVATGLINQALMHCQQTRRGLPQLAIQDVHLSAQCYLIDFYQSCGFSVHGKPYVEDGIPHQDMTLFRTHRGLI